jgi:thiol-disulfide isomerase/thioredoxin
MKRLIPVTTLLLLASLSLPAQESVPTPTPTPRPELLDLRFLRYKISAGDLPSAESVLEVHRASKGEDGEYVLGLAWLARGAALLGDWPAASRYAKAARAIAEARLGTPPDWEHNSEAQYALGTAIEVEAQALVQSGKKADAIRMLDESARAQSQRGAPYNLRARIAKRRNQIELVGQKAPEIRAAEKVGPTAFESLAALKGKPVVLYLWWEACGDCKAQAAALKKIVEKYASRGVAFVAPTRYYGDETERAEEKGKIEKAWNEVYGLTSAVAVPISDEAMLRYGVSATPTFVFVDSGGVVRQYLPYRLTEERLASEIEALIKPGS